MDNIPNVALKTAVNAIPETFLDMHNTGFAEGTFPFLQFVHFYAFSTFNFKLL